VSITIFVLSTKLKGFRSTSYGAHHVTPPLGVFYMLVAGVPHNQHVSGMATPKSIEHQRLELVEGSIYGLGVGLAF
jgi:hypothetical protein